MNAGYKETKKSENTGGRMQTLFPRSKRSLGSGESSASEQKLETILELNQNSWEAEILREEVLKLKLSQLNLVSKDLTGMRVSELKQLEGKLLEALGSVKNFKLKNDAEVNKENVLSLKLKQLKVLLKDLSGMGIYELHHVEQELNQGLLSVLAWKDILMANHDAEESEVMVQEPGGFRLEVPAVRAPICFGYKPEENNERKVYERADVWEGSYSYRDMKVYMWHYVFVVVLLCVWFLVMSVAMHKF